MCLLTHTHTLIIIIIIIIIILEPPPEDNHRRVRADSHTADAPRPPSPISTPTTQGFRTVFCAQDSPFWFLEVPQLLPCMAKLGLPD